MTQNAQDRERRTSSKVGFSATPSVIAATPYLGMRENKTMEWRAATIEDVSKIVDRDLKKCRAEHAATFTRYRVDLYVAPLPRYGRDERVVVVARRRDEVIYWEDVEEGFNCSPISRDGRILEHLCNQDDLCLALHAWTNEDRSRPYRVPDKQT